MTPATSTMRKAFSTSLMDTWSCLEKKSSRSPSSAIEPSLRRGSKGVSAGKRRHSSMPIKSMRPGAIGALTTSLALAAGVRPPEGARADITICDEGDVNQRVLRGQSVDDDVEALVGAEGHMFGN